MYNGFIIMLPMNLDSIANAISSGIKGVVESILDLIKNIFDWAVIPIATIALLATIFFLILSIAKSKRRRDGEDLEEHIKNLFIAIVVLVLVIGYGSFAWGWIDMAQGSQSTAIVNGLLALGRWYLL